MCSSRLNLFARRHYLTKLRISSSQFRREFRATRSDVANLSVDLAPFQDMMRELHARHAILSCCPADSKISLDNIKGRKLIIFISNFATQTGGLAMMKHGTLCGKGDKCLTIHEEIMSALESIKKVPPGTARRFAECVIHVDSTPALGHSNWTSSQGGMPCTKAQADVVTQPLLGKALVALKSALEDNYGASVESIITCGKQARKALSRIDYRSKQELSVPLERAAELDLSPAHGWELMRSDKRELALENHIDDLQTIGAVFCSSRDVASIEKLINTDYAMVTYKCGLSAGTMSEDRRADAVQRMLATKREATNRMLATKAKQNDSKPYGCKSPSNKTITIIGKNKGQYRHDNVKSPCNCGWYEEELLETVKEGYQAKQYCRALKWIETEEYGVVLLHYSGPAGETIRLCGIVYNRSTNKYVRKKDFKAKKKSTKNRARL